MNIKLDVFYTTQQPSQITQSSQAIYNALSQQIYNIKKRLNKINTSMINQSQINSSYSIDGNIDIEETHYYQTVDIDNNYWEISRPIEYSNDFYNNFMTIKLPILSETTNSSYNKRFQNIYPYINLLDYNVPSWYTLDTTVTYSSIVIIKDLYLDEQVYDQKLLIPPVSYTGQEGYKIYINKHEITYNRIQLPSTGLLKTDLTSNYVTDTPDNWYINPKNYFYMFTPGYNRIIIEILYNINNYKNIYTTLDTDGRPMMNFQFDLIINDYPYVSSGLYTYDNLIHQKYMKVNNYQMQLEQNNLVYITNMYYEKYTFNNIDNENNDDTLPE